MHVCPVEIEHIPKIVGLRQSQVLMESKFPLNSTFFRNMETNSNPWGIGFATRADWAEGLPVKRLKDNPEAEYLFWVGCLGSFDEEGKKRARAMAAHPTKAGIDFAILGTGRKMLRGFGPTAGKRIPLPNPGRRKHQAFPGLRGQENNHDLPPRLQRL